LSINDADRVVVIDLLSSSPVTYESIADETSFSLPVIYTICLELELAGRIVRHSGNKISLIY
jgi:DNA processing protein